MAKEFQGLDTPQSPALQECIDAYAAGGYVPYAADPTVGVAGSQYYKPFEGSEPWDCACVAIWKDAEGRVWAEEY